MAVLERDSFLDELDGLLGEAARGRGRLVLVRGEAGIGKTTLAEAFAAGRQSRFFWGTCDPVVPPRPLAPILDIAERAGGPLGAALAEGDQHKVITAFLALLRAEGGPRVAVIEDVQRADEATLELLRVVGRRLAQLPALVLATFRDEEVGPSHPLSLAMGDISPGAVTSLRLPPLSITAVETLASGTALDAAELHARSGGNPFFVSEVVSAGTDELPSTVRDAVWARARRLPAPGLEVTRAAAVLGSRCEAEVVCAVAGARPGDIEDCVARGMLGFDGETVWFRHELVQRAILDTLTPSERSALERRALAVLLARPSGVDPSRAASHAVAAGDADAVLEWASRAGARAALLGAHREARAHYAGALRFADRLTVVERARLLEAHGYECYVGDDLEEAIADQEAAIGCWREAGDPGAEGHALSNLGHYCGWAGQRERGRRAVKAAVELLEPLPPDATLAWSYARLAQFHMIAGDLVVSLEWGERALSLARELGEEEVVVHALNTIGVSEYQLGRDEGWSKLEESMGRALAAESEENIARAFNNLISVSREERRYDLVDRYLADTMQFMAEHDLDATRRCLIGDVAEAELDRGRWAEAEAQAREVLGRGQPSGRLQSAGVLGRLAARRGDGEPSAMLDEYLALATEFNPESAIDARAGRAEAAWLAKDHRAGAAEVRAGLALADSSTTPWMAGKILFWASKLDVPVEGTVASARLAEPYALHLAGHPEKAAAAWATLGCPFEEALALADSAEEADVRRALEIFQSLGAKPAAALVTDRLRSMGARGIARGPRQTTLSNPSALTDRELDVLALLGEGLRNVEIAERLVISAKTVDHHVSAILSKLGVRSRYEAGREAIRLGLASR